MKRSTPQAHALLKARIMGEWQKKAYGEHEAQARKTRDAMLAQFFGGGPKHVGGTKAPSRPTLAGTGLRLHGGTYNSADEFLKQHSHLDGYHHTMARDFHDDEVDKRRRAGTSQAQAWHHAMGTAHDWAMRYRQRLDKGDREGAKHAHTSLHEMLKTAKRHHDPAHYETQKDFGKALTPEASDLLKARDPIPDTASDALARRRDENLRRMFGGAEGAKTLAHHLGGLSGGAAAGWGPHNTPPASPKHNWLGLDDPGVYPSKLHFGKWNNHKDFLNHHKGWDSHNHWDAEQAHRQLANKARQATHKDHPAVRYHENMMHAHDEAGEVEYYKDHNNPRRQQLLDGLLDNADPHHEGMEKYHQQAKTKWVE